MGIRDADHEETASDAPRLIISKLTCSLAGKSETVNLVPGTFSQTIYGTRNTVEQFRCNYGLNPEYREVFERSPLRTAGVDDEGACRIVELPDHRFFVGTLFLPQLTSTRSAPHPLILAYMRSALAYQHAMAKT